MISRVQYILLFVVGLLIVLVGCLDLPDLTETPSAEAQVIAQLEAIHNRYEIDPEQGCFELQSPYEEYHRGLQEMTAVLLTDPAAAGFSMEKRAELFAAVTGFDRISFVGGGPEATLVVMVTNRGHRGGCGSHYFSPDALFVVDRAGQVWDIGHSGPTWEAWWIDGRWIVAVDSKMDSSSGPDPWSIWHIAQTDQGWERVVLFDFSPAPSNFGTLPVHFEDGYQTMIAELTYWQYDHPCTLSESFYEQYDHGNWTTREVYTLQGDSYQQVAFEVTAFTIYAKGTQDEVVIDDWAEQYCLEDV